jgi:hypothetical protein
MSTYYSSTVSSVHSVPEVQGPAFGGPRIGGSGTGGNDDDVFRSMVRALVDAAPAVLPFAAFEQLAPLDAAQPIRLKVKRSNITAITAVGVLLCGLFGGIGAWSIASRLQKAEGKTYRFASLPKGAYLLEATRISGGVVTRARTQQLWKDSQGRYVLVTVTPPDSDESQYLHQLWTAGGLPRSVELSLFGIPKQPAFLGEPSSPLLKKMSSSPILAEWNHMGVIIDVERGKTVLNNPSAYFLAFSDWKMPTQEESVERGKADLAANPDFASALEQLRLVDESNPMLGMKLPSGYTLVDEVVNPEPSFRSVETATMVVRLKTGEVVRTFTYKGPRRTLTLPKVAQEPTPNSYPITPTGVNFSLENGVRIDMEVPSAFVTGTSTKANDQLLGDLQQRLQPVELRAWRRWADASIRQDLDVFERKTWNGIPIFLAWRKSAQNTTSSAIEACFGWLSSTSCTSLDGEVALPSPFATHRSVLLADGRWIVTQRVVTLSADDAENSLLQPIGERLPFSSVAVNALVVPNDQNTYVPKSYAYGRALFRPLR